MIKLRSLKNKLRKPKSAHQRKLLASRDFFRRQQLSKKGGAGDSLCNVYLFSSLNTDSLQLGSPFTGNLKVQIAATAETGLHPDIIAGRQGTFVASADPVNEPIWVQYEISAVAIPWLVNTVYNGRIAYAKDNVWYQLDMGVPNTPPPEDNAPGVWNTTGVWN